MASSIDITKPVTGNASTAAVRQNFSFAKTEIEALQTGKADLATPTLVAPRGVQIAVPASEIDLSAGEVFTKTITENTTFTVSNVPSSGTLISLVLVLTNGGAHTVTLFSGVQWPSGITPTLTTSGTDVLIFFTYDGGTTWLGQIFGQAMA